MAELAPEDKIVSLRRPDKIFTDAYLNDPIQFAPDGRFQPETVLRQLNYIAIIERDSARFAFEDMNAESEEWYPVSMYSPSYDRSDVNTAIDKRFRFLGT